jgi:hypothetical protein
LQDTHGLRFATFFKRKLGAKSLSGFSSSNRLAALLGAAKLPQV